MQKVSERIVNVAEALHLVQKRQKDGELGYEQQNTLAYLEAVSKLSVKDAETLSKALRSLGLTELVVAGLVALLPKKEDDVRQIMAQEGTPPTEDKVKEILKLLKEHSK